jgi:glucose-6-phosphate isomerase
MNGLKLNIDKVLSFVDKETIFAFEDKAQAANKALYEKSGKGNDFLGWVDLPSSIDESILKDIEDVAGHLQKETEIVVVIGIGGSYLGAKSIVEAMSDSFSMLKKPTGKPLILFAGQNIGEDYLSELLQLLDDKKYGIVVISKSGTTTEPAIAFRILKDHLEAKVGEQKAKELIVAVTDAEKGALRTLADKKGYKSYVIPDDVGGRYSVLTPVGLVPLSIGGFDIRQLVKGAREMEKLTHYSIPFEENLSAIYAATRYALYKQGKKIEIFVNYENRLHYLAEWWKQLYGESEGKDSLGIFPASVDLTTDLHSMGQYIQEGERILFETVLSVARTKHKLTVPEDKDNLDKLNYLSGKNIDFVNKMAELGTILAHTDGGVPNIHIQMEDISEYSLGQLMYFFEKACGISGYLLGVNPFNQPGVEEYKRNMFALLEKPGFEEETRKIKERL